MTPSVRSYDSSLLALAEDLAYRLLPAFETPTGIPYGTVNLEYGVPVNESQFTCLAGAGCVHLTNTRNCPHYSAERLLLNLVCSLV